jgi:hypothetical protein
MSHRQAQAGLGLDATVAELLAQDGSLLRVTTRIFAQAEPGLRMAEIAVDEGLPGYVGVGGLFCKTRQLTDVSGCNLQQHFLRNRHETLALAQSSTGLGHGGSSQAQRDDRGEHRASDSPLPAGHHAGPWPAPRGGA